MLELLLLLSALQINDNTTATTQQVQDNTDKISGNTQSVDASTGGVLAAGVALGAHYLNTRKNTSLMAKTGGKAIKSVMQDVISNYRDFRDYCILDKQIMDQAQIHQDMSYFQLLNLTYDVSTKETFGMRKAQFIKDVVNGYHDYYETGLMDADLESGGLKPLQHTLKYVQDKTTAT
jgi:hypothetical protein